MRWGRKKRRTKRKGTWLHLGQKLGESNRKLNDPASYVLGMSESQTLERSRNSRRRETTKKKTELE